MITAGLHVIQAAILLGLAVGLTTVLVTAVRMELEDLAREGGEHHD